MNTDQPVRADERTAAVAHKANTWGLNFITFALLVRSLTNAIFAPHQASRVTSFFPHSYFLDLQALMAYQIAGSDLWS